ALASKDREKPSVFPVRTLVCLCLDNIKPVILAQSTVPWYVVGSTRSFTAEAKPNLDPSSISRHHEPKRFRAIPLNGRRPLSSKLPPITELVSSWPLGWNRTKASIFQKMMSRNRVRKFERRHMS